jgi:translation initiation factor IF-2
MLIILVHKLDFVHLRSNICFYSGLKLFQDDKFYSLCDRFIAYREEIKKEDQKKYQHLAVFPCKLKILPQCVYNVRDPIICGVHVEDGFIKLGTPICIPSKDVCIKTIFECKNSNEFRASKILVELLVLKRIINHWISH